MASAKIVFNVLLLAFILAIGFSDSYGCSVLPNVDYPGNDIGNCLYNVVRIYDCAEQCFNTANCVAFLWGESINPSLRTCCLKTAVVSSNRQFNTVGTTVITGYGDCRQHFDKFQ